MIFEHDLIFMEIIPLRGCWPVVKRILDVLNCINFFHSAKL